MHVTFSFWFICSFSFSFSYQQIKSWRPLKRSLPIYFFFLIFLIISYRRISIPEWLSIFWNFTTTRSDSKWTIRWRKKWDRKRWTMQRNERATQFLDDLFWRGRCARLVYAVSARATNNSENHSDACSTTSRLFWLILDSRRDRKKTVDLDSSAQHNSTHLFFFFFSRKFQCFRRTLRTWSYLSCTCTMFSNNHNKILANDYLRRICFFFF